MVQVTTNGVHGQPGEDFTGKKDIDNFKSSLKYGYSIYTAKILQFHHRNEVASSSDPPGADWKGGNTSLFTKDPIKDAIINGSRMSLMQNDIFNRIL